MSMDELLKFPHRVDIVQIELEEEKDIEPVELYVEFGENYLFYAAEYYANCPKNPSDIELGWENKFFKYSYKFRREQISSVEKRWMRKTEVYKVSFEVAGFSMEISFYFKREVDQKKFYNLLDKFVFG